MKILIIEDSRTLSLAIEIVLRKHGHNVASASDGQMGLSAARTIYPDLILLDMMLPGMEGTAVLRELKRDPITGPIPVVVLSSLSKKNGDALKNAGASAYVEKSALNIDANAGTLLRTIEEFVDKRRADREA